MRTKSRSSWKRRPSVLREVSVRVGIRNRVRVRVRVGVGVRVGVKVGVEVRDRVRVRVRVRRRSAPGKPRAARCGMRRRAQRVLQRSLGSPPARPPG